MKSGSDQRTRFGGRKTDSQRQTRLPRGVRSIGGLVVVAMAVIFGNLASSGDLKPTLAPDQSIAANVDAARADILDDIIDIIGGIIGGSGGGSNGGGSSGGGSDGGTKP